MLSEGFDVSIPKEDVKNPRLGSSTALFRGINLHHSMQSPTTCTEGMDTTKARGRHDLFAAEETCMYPLCTKEHMLVSPGQRGQR